MGRNGRWRLNIQCFNCPEPHSTIVLYLLAEAHCMHRRRPSCPWTTVDMSMPPQPSAEILFKFAPACSNSHREKAPPVHTPIARAWTWWSHSYIYVPAKHIEGNSLALSAYNVRSWGDIFSQIMSSRIHHTPPQLCRLCWRLVKGLVPHLWGPSK